MKTITLIERKTKKGFAVNIYVDNTFHFVAFSESSFANAKRKALYTINNSSSLSQSEILI